MIRGLLLLAALLALPLPFASAQVKGAQLSILGRWLTSGRGGKCKGAGGVTLTQVSAHRANYVFRGGGIVSRGVLRRR